jgi:hypothetical protein
MDARPTSPRDYVPIARQLIAHGDEIAAAARAATESDVAASDQADASARETDRRIAESVDALEAAGIDPQSVVSQRSERYLAWGLAVTGAINRRIPDARKCPHASPTLAVRSWRC